MLIKYIFLVCKRIFKGDIPAFIRREKFKASCHNISSIGDNLSVGRKLILKIENGANLVVGNNVTIGDYSYINVKKGASLIIGDNTFVGFSVRISSFKEIKIGCNCMVAAFTSIYDHDHIFNLIDHAKVGDYTIKSVNISDGVWLSTKVSVLKGSMIGKYSVVGANSVVTKEIPQSCIVGGVPAKVIKKKEE